MVGCQVELFRTIGLKIFAKFLQTSCKTAFSFKKQHRKPFGS